MTPVCLRPSGPAWCPMEEELLAQPQVIKLLDSLREQYTRYQELCRQRNKRTQLDEIHAKVMQVSPGTHQPRVAPPDPTGSHSKCIYMHTYDVIHPVTAGFV